MPSLSIIREKLQRTLKDASNIVSQWNDVVFTNEGLKAFTRNTLSPRVRRELTPKLKGFLKANYDASGIVTRTGKLETAIGNSRISAGFNVRTGQFFARMEMPSGVSDYEYTGNRQNKTTKGSVFYEVASSLNDGAVRRSGGGKSKLSRSQATGIKNLALGTETTVRRRKNAQRTIKLGEDKGNQYAGIPPRNFYKLTDTQQASIADDIERIIEEELSKLGRRAGAA